MKTRPFMDLSLGGGGCRSFGVGIPWDAITDELNPRKLEFKEPRKQ